MSEDARNMVGGWEWRRSVREAVSRVVCREEGERTDERLKKDSTSTIRAESKGYATLQPTEEHVIGPETGSEISAPCAGIRQVVR